LIAGGASRFISAAEALAVSAETARRCELEDGEPLSRSAIRRLTCDASIVSVIERDGKPLELGWSVSALLDTRARE
jgi:hypothetical protein